MAERDCFALRSQHPGVETFVERIHGFTSQSCEQPEVCALREDRCSVEHSPCSRAEPRRTCEHGITDRLRNRPRPGGENLTHEEGVSGCAAEQPLRIDGRSLRQSSNCLLRQRLQLQPADGIARRELPEDNAQRVSAFELVVPIAHEQQRRGRSDPPAEQAKDVERAFIRPVDILEHDDGRWAGRKLVEKRFGYLVRPSLAPHELVERAARLLRDVDERAERPRCEQRVTQAPQGTRLYRKGVTEVPQEDRLADACLAAQEHEPARARVAHGAGPRCQCSERLVSLQE